MVPEGYMCDIALWIIYFPTKVTASNSLLEERFNFLEKKPFEDLRHELNIVCQLMY